MRPAPADGKFQARWGGPTQYLAAEGHTNDAADQERRQPGRLDRLPQLPHRPALHDQAKGGDQRRALSRRQKMQPYRCSDDSKRKARKAGDKCRGKGGQDKQDQVDGIKLAHYAPHRFRRGHAAAAIGQRLACYSLGVVADDLAKSSCARAVLSTTKFPVADPSERTYIAVTGLKQAPRQTVLR